MQTMQKDMIEMDEYICHVRGRYWIQKKIDGRTKYFGSFPTIEEAREHLDYLVNEGWPAPLRECNFYTRCPDGSWAVKRTIGDDKVSFGCYPSRKVAERVVQLLEENGWDKNRLSLLLSENNIPTGVYPSSSHIHYYPPLDNYRIIKVLDGRNVYFGSYDSFDDALPVMEELKDCGWDKNELPRIREKYKNRTPYLKSREDLLRKKIYKHIIYNGKVFIILRWVNGEANHFFSSKSLVNCMYERDALERAGWDMDLWVEQEDTYTYIPELLPDFHVKRRKTDPSMKYIQYFEKTGVFEVHLQKNGKNISIGRYNSLGRAQQVSLICQRHRKDYDEIIYELDVRGIPHAKPRQYHKRHIYQQPNGRWNIHKTINGRRKHFGSYNSLEEAMRVRDELEKNNWKNNV